MMQPPWSGPPLGIRLLDGPDPTGALRRWSQVCRYRYTWEELVKFANRQGTARVYHGAPIQFAERLVSSGPRIPYAVEDVAREVANRYNLPWVEFKEWVYRKGEMVKRLSTASAPIAWRWAVSFSHGEILSEINFQARMIKGSKEYARIRNVSVDDAYEALHQEAYRRWGGIFRYDIADYLGFPDLIPIKREGAIVELVVDARGLPEHVVKQAKALVEWEDRAEALHDWNFQYQDMKVAPSAIKGAVIIVRGFKSWDDDIVNDWIRATGRIHP